MRWETKKKNRVTRFIAVIWSRTCNISSYMLVSTPMAAASRNMRLFHISVLKIAELITTNIMLLLHSTTDRVTSYPDV
jgi:hypothetical protein